MDEKSRCQSCGMPLGEIRDKEGKVVANFGNNRDGSRNAEYCMFCFHQGAFTQPSLTLERMVAMSIDSMTREQGIPELKARELANSVIPKLRRWQKRPS